MDLYQTAAALLTGAIGTGASAVTWIFRLDRKVAVQAAQVEAMRDTLADIKSEVRDVKIAVQDLHTTVIQRLY